MRNVVGSPAPFTSSSELLEALEKASKNTRSNLLASMGVTEAPRVEEFRNFDKSELNEFADRLKATAILFPPEQCVIGRKLRTAKNSTVVAHHTESHDIRQNSEASPMRMQEVVSIKYSGFGNGAQRWFIYLKGHYGWFIPEDFEVLD